MSDHFVDAYSKLVIGSVTIMAPVSTYLLTNYIVGRVKILNKLSMQDRQSKELLDKMMKEAVEKGQSAIDFIKNSNKQLEEREKELTGKIQMLQYLAPKKRMLWLFVPMAFSLAFLFIDLFVRDNIFNSYNHLASCWFLSVSMISFGITVFCFLKLAFKLADAKEILKEEELKLMREENMTSVEEVKTVNPDQK